jgi:hypothetical protein
LEVLNVAYWVCQRSFVHTTARNRRGHVAFFPKSRTLSDSSETFFTVHKVAPRYHPSTRHPLTMIARSAASSALLRSARPSATCSRSAWTWARQGCQRQDSGASSRPASTQSSSSLAADPSSSINNARFAGRFEAAAPPAQTLHQESCPSVYKAMGLQDKMRSMFQPTL